MGNTLRASVLLLATAIVGMASSVRAQEAPPARIALIEPPTRDATVLAGGGYDGVIRWSAGTGVWFSKVEHFRAPIRLQISGNLGVGGAQLAVGVAGYSSHLIGFGGHELRAVVTRTFDKPGKGDAGKTYVGGEIGFNIWGWRAGLGATVPVRSKDGHRDALFTWTVGAFIPVREFGPRAGKSQPQSTPAVSSPPPPEARRPSGS